MSVVCMVNLLIKWNFNAIVQYEIWNLMLNFAIEFTIVNVNVEFTILIMNTNINNFNKYN